MNFCQWCGNTYIGGICPNGCWPILTTDCNSNNWVFRNGKTYKPKNEAGTIEAYIEALKELPDAIDI